MPSRLVLTFASLFAAAAIAPGAASAATTVSPSSLSFSQPVGTTSPPQTATLTLTCGDCFPLAIFTPAITTTPPFTQTNDCPPELVVFFIGTTAQDCTVKVSFAANAAGIVAGTLRTGTVGPTASLSGTGVAPPAVAPAPPAGGTKGKCKKGKKKPKGASAAKKKKCGKKKRGK